MNTCPICHWTLDCCDCEQYTPESQPKRIYSYEDKIPSSDEPWNPIVPPALSAFAEIGKLAAGLPSNTSLEDQYKRAVTKAKRLQEMMETQASENMALRAELRKLDPLRHLAELRQRIDLLVGERRGQRQPFRARELWTECARVDAEASVLVNVLDMIDEASRAITGASEAASCFQPKN